MFWKCSKGFVHLILIFLLDALNFIYFLNWNFIRNQKLLCLLFLLLLNLLEINVFPFKEVSLRDHWKSLQNCVFEILFFSYVELNESFKLSKRVLESSIITHLLQNLHLFVDRFFSFNHFNWSLISFERKTDISFSNEPHNTITC